MTPYPPRYFADENALGLAKELLGRGTELVHPGHPDFPEVPRGAPDLDWLPIVGERELVVLTRDRRIRSRPAELAVYRSYGVRSVWMGGKQDMAPAMLAEMFERHRTRLERLVIKLGPGPWAVTMTPSGIRQFALPEPT